MTAVPDAGARDGAPLLFGLDGSRDLAGRVARVLGVSLAAHEEREFEDGEHKARPLESVRGRDAYVLHSLYGDAQRSANDKLCRLLFFIGALKDAAAGRVTAVVPYLAYARKDRKTQARDPVTTRYVAALFEAAGTDAVATVDVHNLAAFQNAFRCRTEHIEAGALFVGELAPRLAGREVVVVAPDEGGIKRADAFRQRLANALGRPVGVAFCEKYRSGGVLGGGLLAGEVGGRDALIVDDLIGTGATLARAAAACRAHGAAQVFAVATHGLFTGDAAALLADSAIAQTLVCDTVAPFRLGAAMGQARVRVLDCAGMLAAAIDRLHGGGPGTGPPAD
ncbi:ribose-phosphate pyrophosphokinase [Massilia sp. UMI-21]|nr:ribose-phosphate pyrophosphokinase [Massilia sp. UMI-21]